MQVKTDVSRGAINNIFIKQDSEEQWHLCTYYSYKMQPAKQNYKTYDSKFLAIIKAFYQ